MALKISFKVFWRIFLPQIILIWTIIGLMLWYTIRNEQAVRGEIMENSLKNINATVLATYEKGGDIQETLYFIDAYNNNTVLDNLNVTVFNANSEIVAVVGIPIIIEDTNHRKIIEVREAAEKGEATNIREALNDKREKMFNAMTSNDGQITTIASIPFNSRVAKALDYDPVIWSVVIILGLMTTIMVYLIARRMSHVVNSLHQFAQKASQGGRFDETAAKFPKNEIGDVAMEIIHLYREKDRATRRLEHEHQVALRANEERARIKRMTANNLNHEIKTPVGIIKGYIDTILSDPEMPEGLRLNFLKKAQEHVDRLTFLLKDVSSITRLDEAGAQVEVTPFDFHDLVYNIASDLEVSHINEGMDFDWDIPFDTMVLGNYTLLNNALMNLIRNSAKYSKGSVMSLTVIGSDEGMYTFRFADNGTGVGEEHIPHLFDRFYRVDEGRARKSGGTGLGLPIVKSTFEALGGKITVSNAKPHGLEFIFTLKKANLTIEK